MHFMHLGKITFYSGGHNSEDFQMTPNESAIQGRLRRRLPEVQGTLPAKLDSETLPEAAPFTAPSV